MNKVTLYTCLLVVLIAALAAGGGVHAKEDELRVLESEKWALSALAPPNLQLRYCFRLVLRVFSLTWGRKCKRVDCA